MLGAGDTLGAGDGTCVGDRDSEGESDTLGMSLGLGVPGDGKGVGTPVYLVGRGVGIPAGNGVGIEVWIHGAIGNGVGIPVDTHGEGILVCGDGLGAGGLGLHPPPPKFPRRLFNGSSISVLLVSSSLLFRSSKVAPVVAASPLAVTSRDK